jgi:hypothetical protein
MEAVRKAVRISAFFICHRIHSEISRTHRATTAWLDDLAERFSVHKEA